MDRYLLCGRELHATDLVADPAFQRTAAAIHRLGERCVAEALATAVVLLNQQGREALLAALREFRRLSADQVKAAGGATFPARPPLPVPRQ